MSLCQLRKTGIKLCTAAARRKRGTRGKSGMKHAVLATLPSTVDCFQLGCLNFGDDFGWLFACAILLVLLFQFTMWYFYRKSHTGRLCSMRSGAKCSNNLLDMDQHEHDVCSQDRARFALQVVARPLMLRPYRRSFATLFILVLGLSQTVHHHSLSLDVTPVMKCPTS